MKNIVLLGFMGTGKTTVARLVAKKLNFEYASTDDLIEKKEGMRISDIFAKKGEPFFREREKEAVAEVSSRQGLVIDAGGGAVLKEENIRNFRKNGVLVCLWASPEKILERVGKGRERPLLNVPRPLDKIKELLEYRKVFYDKADYHIDTSAMTSEEASEKVVGYYRRAG